MLRYCRLADGKPVRQLGDRPRLSPQPLDDGSVRRVRESDEDQFISHDLYVGGRYSGTHEPGAQKASSERQHNRPAPWRT